MAQDLKEAVKNIQEIQKSLDAQLDHANKSVEQSKDELAAQEEANKHVADVKVSDDNEKVAKKDKEADKACETEKCGDTVEESAKSVKKDTNDGDEEATGSEEEKSVKKDDDDSTGDTDVAENSVKPANDNVKKDTDGKVEENKAKQAKELNNVEDVKGHEEASKAMIGAVNALTKAVETMEATNKSYGVLLADLDTIVKSYRPSQVEVEKSAVKSDKKDSESVTDSESTTKKCGDKVEESGKAKKSEKAEKSDTKEAKCDSNDEKKCEVPKEEKAKKSVEESDDQAEKSMPVGQAVYSENEDKVEKSVKAEPEEEVVSAGEMKNALRKSIIAFAGSELPENMVKVNAMKSLYRSVENMDDKESVKKSIVDAYNRI